MTHPENPEFPLGKRNRRTVLAGLAGTATLAAGTSAMPEKAFSLSQAGTDLPQFEFVFDASIKRGDPMDIGQSKFGARRVVNLLGGSFEGPKIKGEIPPGGTSIYVARADGATVVDAQYVLKTSDGALIFTRNGGLIVPGPEGAPPYIRTTASFEAPEGPYDWLNKALFIGLAHPNQAAQTSNLSIYRLL